MLKDSSASRKGRLSCSKTVPFLLRVGGRTLHHPHVAVKRVRQASELRNVHNQADLAHVLRELNLVALNINRTERVEIGAGGGRRRGRSVGLRAQKGTVSARRRRNRCALPMTNHPLGLSRCAPPTHTHLCVRTRARVRCVRVRVLFVPVCSVVGRCAWPPLHLVAGARQEGPVGRRERGGYAGAVAEPPRQEIRAASRAAAGGASRHAGRAGESQAAAGERRCARRREKPRWFT